MRLKLKENKIMGYGAFGNKDYPIYSGEIPKEITDIHGNPLYGFIDGKIVPLEDPRTLVQLEKERTDAIEREIPYTLAQEIALTNKGIKNKEDPEYLEYRETVDKIKKSHKEK